MTLYSISRCGDCSSYTKCTFHAMTCVCFRTPRLHNALLYLFVARQTRNASARCGVRADMTTIDTMSHGEDNDFIVCTNCSRCDTAVTRHTPTR